MRENTLNDNISVKVSIYSESLRNRLGKIADFKDDFELAFGGFVENTLPKDELYKQIEEEIEAKRKKKKDGANALTATVPAKEKEKLLPDVNEEIHERTSKKIAGHKAEQEKELIREHDEKEAKERDAYLTKMAKKKKKTGEVMEEEDKPLYVNHEDVEFKLAKQFD